MRRDVVIERTYPHPPERIWKALTDPAALQTWLMKNDFKAEVGHRFQFRDKPRGNWDGIVHCEVLEVEVARRLVYTWGSSALKKPTTVTWTLTPEAGGTRLRLEHRGFEGVFGVLLSFMLGSGWKKKILHTLLPSVLERDASGPSPSPSPSGEGAAVSRA